MQFTWKDLGYGEYHEELEIGVLQDFLSRLDIYNKSLLSYNQDGNKDILKEIDSLIEQYSC